MVVFVNKRLGVQKEKATFSSKERKAQLISQPVYKQQCWRKGWMSIELFVNNVKYSHTLKEDIWILNW